MPFIGRDWRSPGEAWVKTETLGWQRMKIIESQLYPTACHQQSPACSWPPRNEYGQHMYNHCRASSAATATATAGHHCDVIDTIANTNNNTELTGVNGTGETGTKTSFLSSDSSSDATSSSGSSSGSSSANSSRNGSLSPSPSSSPEKNTPHHIHPIAISSPYGWHSCFAHRPQAATNCCSLKNHHHHHHHHHQSTDISRSLSKESLISTSNDIGIRNSTMRYNRSVSDFRDVTSQTNCNSDQEPSDKTQLLKTDNRLQRLSPESVDNENGCVYMSPPPPILMENGRRIIGHPNELNLDTEQKKSTAPSFNELNQSSQNGKHCCCYCCCHSGTGSTGSQIQPACNLYSLGEKPVNGPKMAPHCRISVRTREVAMYNTISEAFYRLDFCNAIHDIRRFNYICKLLHLLITQNLTSLSGCATRVLFNMLEQVAWEVSNNKRNIHILKNLLKELRQMIEKYYCWGRPIGSSLLWRQHFETIERISQIVNGIELAPPKSQDNVNQATFNDLPVEMIREILLRLNDYKDLVNSAQASPVMQIMIDNQYIWQKLCKYHFTEQQLKLALENRNNYRGHQLGTSCTTTTNNNNKQRTNQVQGIKYARTASADGRSSYRNPVNSTNESTTQAAKVATPASAASKSMVAQSSSATSSGSISNSGGGCGGGQKRNQSSSSSSPSSSSSSYVTRAIRIFDREGSSASLNHTNLVRDNEKSNAVDGLGNAEQTQPPTCKATAGNGNGQRRQSRSNTSQSNDTTNVAITTPNKLVDGSTTTSNHQQTSTTATNTNNLRPSSSNRNIDWERVFHQLRKKFDLKEEYPDCLLLCRHCRCLFWKSFGHPCIKTDDIRLDGHTMEQRGVAATNNATTTGQRSAAAINLIGRLDAGNNNNNNSSRNDDRSSLRGVSRPSVADLSRNFNQTEERHRSSSTTNDENQRPSQGGARQIGNNNRSSMNSSNLDPAAQFLHARRPLTNSLRGDNNNNNHNRNNNLSTSSERSAAVAKRDELIPKHVAISPQAFLKFFSL